MDSQILPQTIASFDPMSKQHHIPGENNRARQGWFYAAAVIGLGILTFAVLSAGTASANAETRADAPREETAATTGKLSPADIAAVKEVDAYLNGMKRLQGDFLQIGADGSMAQGKFFIRRPGRARFEYDPPANQLVVADGFWVAVKEGDAPAQRIPLSSLPFAPILDEKVDLLAQTNVLDVEKAPGVLRIKLTGKDDGLPGTVTLVFDQPNLQLRQWVVTDAQGLQTTVALRNVRAGVEADNALFVLRDDQRPSIGGSKN
ncbi:MAG: cell envelope biogenesis protein LolA [Parvibaculum sp.]|nr:cell envelope biogenesis protein LolA [Parvibaculum sp.]